MLPQSHFKALNSTKFKHFSNALRDSTVYIYQLHTSISHRIGRQQDALFICAKVL